MSEFAIEVKHLDKMYKLYNKPSDRLREALGFKVPVREHYALRDVNFEVKRGETVGIIGTNGSGKSTITSIAAGMQPATSGEMFFKGQPHKPSTMIEGAACGIGMIVQEQGTVSGISVAQNILALRWHWITLILKFTAARSPV